MSKKIELLDCTLRDGSYINASQFGTPAIKGIIKKMQDARIDIIECGWLKDNIHKEGSAFFHVPQDAASYIIERNPRCMYVTMIDWNRYDTTVLPPCDNKTIDAVRVVFPHGKHKEGLEVAKKILDKGYKVLLQLANTISYSDKELEEVASCANALQLNTVSIVDTFGAMFFDDLERIVKVLDKCLRPDIRLGFHSHNNQQLSFALSMHFIELLSKSDRHIVIDASLSGMGRGAGNATTELISSYLNRRWHGDYDMDCIMDAIDMYIEGFKQKYTWGYSTAFFIAGMYECHVNNIAYLQKNHRTSACDMRNIIASLSQEERRKYDYDLLERRYIENQNHLINDEKAIAQLKTAFLKKTVVLIAPGKSINTQEDRVKQYLKAHDVVTIGVNAINTRYTYDYLFFINNIRYDYARQSYEKLFLDTKKILLSNVKSAGLANEYVVNFNSAIKRGWEHFDNAVICALRLLNKLDVANVALAGFDGFKTQYNESYCDENLPTLNPDGKWDMLNEETRDMFNDFRLSVKDCMNIEFITDSIYNTQ